MKNTAVNYQHEEKLNAVSHGLGVLLGVVGFVFLIFKNGHKNNYATSSIIVYSLSIITLFLASTLFHSSSKVHLRRKLRIFDHISIFLLIAGTYTPLVLITLEEGNGWLIFYTVWAIAGVGALLKLFFTGKYEIISILLYVVMGWLIILDYQDLMLYTSKDGLKILLLGSMFYCLGIVFYVMESLPYNHFVWHLFVLGGAIFHWIFIYGYVV